MALMLGHEWSVSYFVIYINMFKRRLIRRMGDTYSARVCIPSDNILLYCQMPDCITVIDDWQAVADTQHIYKSHTQAVVVVPAADAW